MIPKIDVQFSGVMQSKPGALLAANYAVPAADIARSLGRAPSGNVTNVTVNLLTPGSMYGDRINQLDFRAAKILRFGRTKTMIGVDRELDQRLADRSRDIARISPSQRGEKMC